MTAPTTTPELTASVTRPWDRLLLAATVAVIAADTTVQVLAGTVIPPLAGVTLVTLLGLALYRWRRRVGIATIGAVALLWGLGSLGFSFAHLQHPESGIDFVHATIEVIGRATIVVAAVAAWRDRPTRRTRPVALGAAGLLAVAVVVGTAASLATGGETALASDTAVTVEHAEFPASIQVASGETLHVDNADLFRHTFTVEGTDIDVELPSARGTRVTIDLPPGTYDVTCEVPGHEFMSATLEVE